MTKKIEVSPTVKILQDAQALVARCWIQGPYEAPCAHDGKWHTGYCIMGALRAVSRGGVINVINRYHAAMALTTELNRVSIYGLVSWNETRRRTQKEVVALFDKAIAKEMGVPQL